MKILLKIQPHSQRNFNSKLEIATYDIDSLFRDVSLPEKEQTTFLCA